MGLRGRGSMGLRGRGIIYIVKGEEKTTLPFLLFSIGESKVSELFTKLTFIPIGSITCELFTNLLPAVPHGILKVH